MGINMKIKNILQERKDDENTAVICRDRKVTYTWLYQAGLPIISLLKKAENPIIALYLPNDIAYMISYFAILSADKIVLPVMQMSGLDILKRDIGFCDIDCVITHMDHKQYFMDHFENSSFTDVSDYGITVIHIGKNPEVPHEHLVAVKEDVCLILKTSGTTGPSDYVMLTNNNLTHMITIFCTNYNISPESNNLTNSMNMLPFPSSYGNAQMLMHFYLGVPFVIYDGNFVPEKFWKIISNYQVPRTEVIPTIIMKLVNDNAHEQYDISSFSAINTGGAEISQTVMTKFKERFPGVSLLQSYGMTEAAPIITMMDFENWNTKTGSVGKPIKSLIDIKIADDSEIMVKGLNVMAGYYKNEQLSKEVLADGWLHTGDTGHFDSDGYLYITGRKKNIIISGGYNISPEEIEQIIGDMEGVADVGIYAKSHSVLGECIIAKVVLKPTAVITGKNIRDYCKEKLEIYKVPKEIEFVDVIERNATGKIKR